MNKYKIGKKPRHHIISINSLNNEESDNNSWLVIFSDLLSLILAFFVLIYISYLDTNGGWDKLLNSIRMSFSLEHVGEFSISNSNDDENKLKHKIPVQDMKYVYLDKLIKLKISEKANLVKYNHYANKNSVDILLFGNGGADSIKNLNLSRDIKDLVEIFNSLPKNKVSIKFDVHPERDDKFIETLKIADHIIKLMNKYGYSKQVDVEYYIDTGRSDAISFIVR